MNMFKKTAIGGTLLLSLLSLAACGGGGGSTPAANNGGGTPPSPSAYPTGQDANDSAASNGSIATATPQAVGDNTVNTIWPQGDQDYYAVDLVAGTEYEFSANNICASCDVYLHLYDAMGTELAADDDYIGYDSRLLFTPAADGTYYVMIRAFNTTFGVAQYTVGVRVFVDADGDAYSDYYDCDETDATIYPRADEIAGDGIDQNCSGVDRLVLTTADSAEVDNTPAQAREMTAFTGYYRELQYRDAVFMDNARTLHDAADEDWFTVTLAPNSAVRVRSIGYASSGLASIDYFEPDAVTLTGPAMENPTANPMTFYVRLSGSNAAGAHRVVGSEYLGRDLDGDGYYNQNRGSNRDCDDSDATIYPTATEIDNDGIDQDCNGSDSISIAPIANNASVVITPEKIEPE